MLNLVFILLLVQAVSRSLPDFDDSSDNGFLGHSICEYAVHESDLAIRRSCLDNGVP